MNPRRVASEMWPTLVFGGGLVVLVACVGSAKTASAVRAVDRLAPSLAANVEAATAPKAPATANPVVASPVINGADVAVAAELLAEVAVDTSAQDKQRTDKAQTIVVATLTDPSEVLAEGNASAQVAAAAAPDAPQDAAPGADATPDGPAIPGRIEIVGECLVAEACIDQFLWALYERTPKQDTIKESERRKVSVRNKKGKLVKVTKTFTRLVNNDFTWKDPKAAERIKMSMIDYVIGGMEKSFKLKLFRMLYAAENAGLSPGITSAFRDDYRQSIASGLKAASDRSYHGGSSRGGYGHGLAADIVSVKGSSKTQRWVSTEALWKWVDANGKEYGVGRPYLDRDPPHVGPMDGQEYVSRRGGAKAADAKKSDKQAAQVKPAAKRPLAARASKAKAG
jgi:D-alanyl-D-alanine carboxypeptidase